MAKVSTFGFSISISISLSNEYSALISFRIDWLDLLAVQGTLKKINQLKKIIIICLKRRIGWFSPSVMSNSLRPHGLQHASLPCPDLLEFAQTYVHWVGDAIQPSHPLLFPFPPIFNPSQHQGLFKWVSSSYQVAKVLECQLQHQSFQWIFRTDFL